MIRPGVLSAAERLELEACMRRQRKDHGIARRANAILLLDGKPCQEISDFLYLDNDTIRGWYKSTGKMAGRPLLVMAGRVAGPV